jgi:hypothetical protein
MCCKPDTGGRALGQYGLRVQGLDFAAIDEHDMLCLGRSRIGGGIQAEATQHVEQQGAADRDRRRRVADAAVERDSLGFRRRQARMRGNLQLDDLAPSARSSCGVERAGTPSLGRLMRPSTKSKPGVSVAAWRGPSRTSRSISSGRPEAGPGGPIRAARLF